MGFKRVPMFGEVKHCPACGLSREDPLYGPASNPGVSTRYITYTSGGATPVFEHGNTEARMQITCPRCGCVWNELPLYFRELEEMADLIAGLEEV